MKEASDRGMKVGDEGGRGREWKQEEDENKKKDVEDEEHVIGRRKGDGGFRWTPYTT